MTSSPPYWGEASSKDAMETWHVDIEPKAGFPFKTDLQPPYSSSIITALKDEILDYKRDLDRCGAEILITSSHRPPRRVRSLINDLARTLPKATRINRGKKSIEELRDLMRLASYRALIIVNTWKANPGRIDAYLREGDMLRKIGSLYISSIKLSREQRVSNCFFKSPQIEYSECSTKVCRDTVDILSQILGSRYGDRHSDEKIYIELRERLYIWFSREGRICGPRIGIRAAYREI